MTRGRENRTALQAPRRRNRLLAYALGGVGLGSNAMVYFLLPLHALELGIGLSMIGVLLSVKSLTETALSVPIGAFIDRVGPRQAYLFGSGGIAVAGAGFLAANSVVWLFVFQVILGMTRPMAWVGGQAYVSAMREGPSQSSDTGRFSFAANVGQIVSPLIAGLAVQLFGERLAFGALVVYGLAFFLLATAVPEVQARGHEPGSGMGLRTSAKLLKLRSMQVVVMLTFARLWLPSVWMAFLPVFLTSAGTPAGTVGTAAASMALVATVVSLFAGRAAKLGRPALVTAVALGISCLGVGLTPLATEVPAVYVPAAMVGIGQGLSLPMLLVLVSAAAPEGQRSLALGLRSGVNQAAATAAPLAIAPVIAIGGLAIGFPIAAGVGVFFLAGAVILDHGIASQSLGRRARNGPTAKAPPVSDM